MKGIEIFIDESGDFGQFDERCPYYIVTLVRHFADDPILAAIGELEYRLSLLGLENTPVHTSPAIRGEGIYHGMELAVRRRLLACFSLFLRKSALAYKTMAVRKKPGMDADALSNAIANELDAFLSGIQHGRHGRCALSVVYDRGQPQLAKILTTAFNGRFAEVRHLRSLPIYARLFQAADFVCTMERIGLRFEDGVGFSKPELVFFETKRRFEKDWLKPLRKKLWV